jgi:hypothetical protein
MISRFVNKQTLAAETVLESSVGEKWRTSSVSIVTGLQTGQARNEGFGLRAAEEMLCSTDLGLNRLPVQWAPWALSPEINRQCMKLATHLHLAPNFTSWRHA